MNMKKRSDAAYIQHQLGLAYSTFPSGDRRANLEAAIASYQAALRVYTPKKFPLDWARTQRNLGDAYRYLPGGDRRANLEAAIASYQAALRVYTLENYPEERKKIEESLSDAFHNLESENQKANQMPRRTLHETSQKPRHTLYEASSILLPVPPNLQTSEGNLAVAIQPRPGQTVGSNLRAARLAHKLTQSQLARPDFSVSYVSAIERGQIEPSLRALEIFAQRLGITSTDLLSRAGGHLKSGISEKVIAHESELKIELELLEAQLLILQGDDRKAVELLRNLSSAAFRSDQEIRQYYLLGTALYGAGMLQESEAVLTDAYQKVAQENDYFTRRILNMMGLVYVAMQNHTQGFDYQMSMVHQLESEKLPHDVFFDAQIYANIGLHYQDLNQSDDAIEMFRSALAQTNEFLSAEQITILYWNMSQSFAETQQYFQAMLYAYKALLLLMQQNDHSIRSEIYHYLGQAMLQQDGQEALPIIEKFIQDAASNNDTLAVASLTATIAELLYKQGELDRAFEYAQRANEVANTQVDSMITASILLTAGTIAYAQENYQIGDRQILAALDMIKRLENMQEYASQCERYARLLEERGQPEEALTYYKKAVGSGWELA